MDKKLFFEVVTRYWRCKETITTESQFEAEARLNTLNKYGFAAELMRYEIKSWRYILSIDELVKSMPDAEYKFFFDILQIENLNKANTTKIANSMEISTHTCNSRINSIIIELSKFMDKKIHR